MWRHITRGLQQRLRKTTCLDKTDNCPIKSETDNTAQYQGSKCRIIRTLLPATYQNLNCCISKYTQKKNNKKNYHENPSGNVGQHTFLEAFGWSGALVFGWAISKHIWLNQKWSRDEEKKFLSDQSVIQLLALIVKTQPPVNFVLPQSQRVSTVHKKKKVESDELSTQNTDEELDKAAKELIVAHERAIGEALNRRGIACLSKSTSSEAIKYFTHAAELKYPPASFNIGQCYELGIGTKQDFKLAADWYQVASDQGHATAMYNLGVFYAHGWGGLVADIDSAKNLFTKAAKLGQPDAIAALDKESKNRAFVEYHCKTEYKKDLSLTESITTAHKTSSNILVNNIKQGLTDDVNLFQKGFVPGCNWNISLNNAIAF